VDLCGGMGRSTTHRSGIYKITIGPWFYYGQTNNFKRRRKEHLGDLRGSKHDNAILQKAWNKYQTFYFEECAYESDPELLTELEQLIIDEAFEKPNCANLNRNADKPPNPATYGFQGKKHSDETKAKMSASGRGLKKRPLSEEHKAKLSAARLGKKRNEQTKAKISAANKGKPKSEEHKAKISAVQKGVNRKPQTPEHIAKRAEAVKAYYQRIRSERENQ